MENKIIDLNDIDITCLTFTNTGINFYFGDEPTDQ